MDSTRYIKIKRLRNTLLATLVIVALLSAYNVGFIYPAFTRLMIDATRNDALRAARHLSSLLVPDPSSQLDVLDKEVLNRAEKIKAGLELTKLRIYSAAGKTFFSTDPRDVGKMNARPYFHDFLAAGKVYTQVVARNHPSMEGDAQTHDVVEAYVPIMKDGQFLGAFEIYYDITDRKHRFDRLSHQASAVLLTLMLGLIFSIGVAFFREVKSTAERKRTQAALQESRSRLAGILDAVSDMMLVVDRNGAIVWANQLAADFIGTDRLSNRRKATDRPILPAVVQSCFQDGRSHEEEMEIDSGDGVTKNFWCTVGVASRIDDGVAETVIVVYRDVTEKKLLRAETARACQLASVGELAAGVAHEINNPINGVINCAQLLLDDADISPEQSEIAHRIRKAGDRIAMIVRNLLSFSRGSTDAPEPIRLQQILSDSLELVEAQIKSDGIDLKISLPEEFPLVRAQGHQIQQVFLNIISNARYALNRKYTGVHDDKRLTINAQTIHSNGRGFARLTFMDSGGGIAPNVIDRICDPFFSTKPVGEGTGLGLSVSHAIVKDHGGRIMFDSTEGRHTRVIIDLPLADTRQGETLP